MAVARRAVELSVVGPVAPVTDPAREVAVAPRGADVGSRSARAWRQRG
jgi:hypothetical protein